MWADLLAAVVYLALGAAWYRRQGRNGWRPMVRWSDQFRHGAKPAMDAVAFALELVAAATLAVLSVNTGAVGVGGGAGLGAILAAWR